MDIIFFFIGVILSALCIYILMNKKQSQLKTVVQILQNDIKTKDNQIILLENTKKSIEAESRNLLQQAKDFETRYEMGLHTIEDLNIQLKDELIRKQELLEEKLSLATENSLLHHQFENQKKESEALHQKTKLEFEQIAQKLLEEKTERFTAMNQTNMESILKPLNENIHAFKKQVEDTYDKESKMRFSLDERIRELMMQTNKISSEANNLANALKGNHKKQGDWGEMILESILQQSGLVKDREYRVQHNLKTENNENVRPDIIVDLPNQKSIVIDSKVSLVAYDSYCVAEQPEEAQLALSQHIKAIRTHVDQLSAKNYNKLVDGLDFTMLFVPIEPAYLLAIQNDPKLWSDAYQKRILLISPTNLIACLKLIVDLWNRDKQDKSALKIVAQSEKLYDKLVNFVESFEKVGRQLQNAQDSYQTAVNQMKMGRGNLMSQAHQLLQFGVNPKKRLPDDFEEDHLIEAD